MSIKGIDETRVVNRSDIKPNGNVSRCQVCGRTTAYTVSIVEYYDELHNHVKCSICQAEYLSNYDTDK